MISLAERLKQLRQEYGITQKYLAKEIGTNDRNYRRYEAGEVDPPASTIVAIANYFCISLDYLVGRVDTLCSEEYIHKAEEDFFKYCKTEDENRGLNLLKHSLFNRFPADYKDTILRKQNYSLETRVKILFILKTVFNDYKESIINFEHTKEQSESGIFADISAFIDYKLQKIGFKKIPATDTGYEDKKNLKLVNELQQLLHDTKKK